MADDLEPPELGPLRDNSVLWRLSLWGGAATVAVAAAALITQSDIGADRLLAVLAPQSQIASSAGPQLASNDDLVRRVEAQRVDENRRLEARIRELSADRDRLNSRVALLEQNLSDVTGSIKRDLAVIAATSPKAMPAAHPASPAPVLTAPPATAAAPEAAASTRKNDTKAMPPPEAAPAPVAEARKPAEAAIAPPPQIALVPMPPARVAAVTPPAQVAEHKPELAIEIGGARTMDILNARWVAVKANFGPLIEGLSPLVRHDARPGIIPYRLIVGPLPNGAAAAQLCSRFAASKVPCRTTEFTGDKFAQP
ncbi:MAG: hypothetical protein WC670_06020 [Pseudolabrys sp.]|jgi:hypothetical protein